MLDPQEPTVSDQPERIVIYEDDEVLLDTADPSTYIVLSAGPETAAQQLDELFDPKD